MLGVDAEQLDGGRRTCDGERLVDLEQVDVAERQAGAVERLRDRLRPGPRPVSAGSTPTDAHDRIGGQRGQPERGRSAITIAAAASLAPHALPAVMRKPSISGCSGFSEASFSMVVSRRGCSSTANECRAGVLDRDDLVLEAALVDGARWRLRCDRSAQASISSRVTPALTAAFQPTVIDMSRLGASGRSGWRRRHPGRPVSLVRPARVDRGDGRGGVHAAGDDELVHAGADAAAALCTAARPEAQCRLTREARHLGQARGRSRRSGRRRRRRRAPRPASRRRPAAGSRPLRPRP